MLLTSIINGELHQPFLLLQSSSAQSGISILRQILSRTLEGDGKTHQCHFVLFCLVHPPSNLLDHTRPLPPNFKVHDWTQNVPGYQSNWTDPRGSILSIVENAPPGSLDITLDSIDTLLSDIGSTTETYRFLCKLFALIRIRPSPSRLFLHALQPSKLVPLLIQPSFAPSLIYLIAHPPILLTHLANDYLTPPPPMSTVVKFWSVFLPLSERGRDIDRLVFGSDGRGSGGATEMVVEILSRSADSPGWKRGIERVVEGWALSEGGACDLPKLESLRSVWTKKVTEKLGSDPTLHPFFNLKLTHSQQESRAQVPLPYAHKGGLSIKQNHVSSNILYDPDSADDIDDDDPDEDLDI